MGGDSSSGVVDGHSPGHEWDLVKRQNHDREHPAHSGHSEA